MQKKKKQFSKKIKMKNKNQPPGKQKTKSNNQQLTATYQLWVLTQSNLHILATTWVKKTILLVNNWNKKQKQSISGQSE